MQVRNSPRAHIILYPNAVLEFKILKFLCQFICLMVKFKGLQSQEIFSISEIIFCHNSSLEGQYYILQMQKNIRTLGSIY